MDMATLSYLGERVDRARALLNNIKLIDQVIENINKFDHNIEVSGYSRSYFKSVKLDSVFDPELLSKEKLYRDHIQQYLDEVKEAIVSVLQKRRDELTKEFENL